MVMVGMQPDKPALRIEGLHAASVIVDVRPLWWLWACALLGYGLC